jgi:hypothetical protein
MPIRRKSWTRGAAACGGILIFLLLCWNARAEKLFDKSSRKQLAAYLLDICNWMMASNTPDAESRRKKDDEGSIAINAAFARALLAAAEYSPDPKGMQETALRWCDSFAKRQQILPSAQGNTAGYWLDHGQSGDLNLTASGAAACTLVLAALRTEGSRRQDYLSSLQNYSRLVLEGCKEDPLQKGRGGSSGWVLQVGKAKGALGAGYWKDGISRKPSTSSTAIHTALFAGLFRLTQESRYRDLSLNGMEWLMKIRRANGETFWLEEGEEVDEKLFRSADCLAEALQATYYLLADAGHNQKINQSLGSSLRWLVESQGERGWWGEGEDRWGSPGIASLMYWDLQFGTKNQQLPAALDRYWQAISNPVHRQSFGVEVYGQPSSLVALSIAETLKPGSTFR